MTSERERKQNERVNITLATIIDCLGNSEMPIPPTVREIGKAIATMEGSDQISTSVVSRCLDRLVEEGYIFKPGSQKGFSRNIILIAIERLPISEE